MLGCKDYKDCTAFGGITFTAYRGYQGDFSLTKYLNSNYIPSVDGIQYTLNANSFGVYSRTSSSSSRIDMGCSDGTRQTALMSGNTTLANARVASNQIAIGVSFAIGTDTKGMLIVNRTTAANIRTYKDGSFVDQANVTNGLPTKSVFVGANNNNGVVASATNKEYCFAFVGNKLSDLEITTLATRLETYLDYVGAGVMP